MKAILLRRPKLGRTSCNAIGQYAGGTILPVLHTKGVPEADVVFRWGCTANVVGDPIIVNSARGIHLVNDKGTFRKTCADAGLAPRTWLSLRAMADELGLRHHGELPFPVVLRPSTHAQGKHVYLCRTMKELTDVVDQMHTPKYYISEFIEKTAEYRVFVAQGRVVWVARKTPGNPDDVAWNVAQGGRFDNVRWGAWDMRVCRAAIAAMDLTSLTFGGVDVMVGSNRQGTDFPLVLEINSAPSHTSPYRQQCTGKVFKYMVDREFFGYINSHPDAGWRGVIHPAISNEAVN